MSDDNLRTDGGAKTRDQIEKFPVPVTVPKPVEETARDRLEYAKDAPEDAAFTPDFDRFSEREVLEDFILEQLEIELQLLTRDVENEKFGEPVTHALHTLVTERHHDELVRAANDRGENLQEFVRAAALERAGIESE